MSDASRVAAAGALAAALIALACPAVADAQVYKCVDRAGRTTYQQQPCPEAQTGGRLSLPVDNGSTQQRGERAPADLDPQARLKKIVPGMTRAAVAQAHGTPQEMRPGGRARTRPKYGSTGAPTLPRGSASAKASSHG